MNNLKAIQAIKKKYGDLVFVAGENKDRLSIPRYSTGSLGIDIATGGGIPQGRITLLYGDESTGKTLLSLNTIRSAQMKDKKALCGFIDAEGSFDFKWAEHLGIDLDRLVYAGSDNLEQAFDVLIAFALDGLDVIVFDSIASSAPIGEIDGEMGDNQVALQARVVNKGLRKLQAALNAVAATKKPTVIMINQIRQKITLYGDPTTIPGGLGQRFFSSLSIRLTRGKAYPWENDKDVLGSQDVRWKIAKSKICAPGAQGTYQLILAGPRMGAIDTDQEVLAFAQKYGVVEKAGAWFKFGEESVQGLANLKHRAADIEPLLYEKLKEVLGDEYKLSKMAP